MNFETNYKPDLGRTKTYHFYTGNTRRYNFITQHKNTQCNQLKSLKQQKKKKKISNHQTIMHFIGNALIYKMISDLLDIMLQNKFKKIPQ